MRPLSGLTAHGGTPNFADVEELKRRVRLGYSRPWVVAKYSTVGLWPSERELCGRFWPDGARILDLGCGAGRTTIPLAQAGYGVVGVDIAQPMVGQAARYADHVSVPCRFGVADATDLPFHDDAFDGILFSYNGIELIPKQEGKKRAIAEAHRVLRPGGTLIFTTHAFEAFNRFALDRLQRLLLYALNRLLRRAPQGAEFGEVIPDPDRTVEVYYMQINSPRRYRRLLRDRGFDLIYYNSRARIDAGRPPRRIADFDADFKFYVARKPA